MQCEYCKNLFSSKSILNNHQKTAKYCIQLRKETKQINISCQACGKSFSHQSSLDRHSINCIIALPLSKLTKEIETLKIELTSKTNSLEKAEMRIRELEQRLENVATAAASRPTTTKNTQINNYIQNMQPVTDEVFTENIDKFNIDYILKGPGGYAEYALEHPLKDRVACVDYSRRKIKFKDKDGNIITDPEMSNLSKKFFQSIHEKNNELILKYQREITEKYGIDSEEINNLIVYVLGVKHGSNGEKSDFHHEFVKEICNKTIRE